VSGFKVDSVWVKSRQHRINDIYSCKCFLKDELLNLILKAVRTKAQCVAEFYCIMSPFFFFFADTAKRN